MKSHLFQILVAKFALVKKLRLLREQKIIFYDSFIDINGKHQGDLQLSGLCF